MRRPGCVLRIVLGLIILVLAPAAARAQSAIAGVVKDTSGAVMPGVTVEAASPALIERTRSVVTDGQGLYKIVDLRPGVYDVIFTLPGFNTVKRDAIELPANFTATVNAELRVGALEETVTVSGQSPVVDVQNAVQQTVLSRQVLDAVPTGRSIPTLGALLPGARLVDDPIAADRRQGATSCAQAMRGTGRGRGVDESSDTLSRTLPARRLPHPPAVGARRRRRGTPAWTIRPGAARIPARALTPRLRGGPAAGQRAHASALAIRHQARRRGPGIGSYWPSWRLARSGSTIPDLQKMTTTSCVALKH